MKIEWQYYVLKKDDNYYCGGVNIWSPFKFRACKFWSDEAVAARRVLHGNENITIEEASV